jgi:tetratricopeptide (TPR) repeat protein
LAHQVANRSLASEQTATIHRLTEGNPLMIQEMARAETPARSPVADAGIQTVAPSYQSPLSTRMQPVIEARLARLSPEAQSLAALAATIGRSFTFAILQQASGANDDRLVAALDELWQRRIVREQGSDSYDFSHDTIREVAYAGISPMRRRLLHRQVAQALEQMHADELDLVSARIATHYRQAGELAKAAAYYLRAANTMQFGYAHDEMLAHLQQGLAVLQGQPRTQENVSLAIALYLALGRIVTAREVYGSPGAIAAFETARRLCIEADNQLQLVRVQEDLRIAYVNQGNAHRARALAESNLELAIQLSYVEEIERAHAGLGMVFCTVGELVAAQRHFQQSAVLAGRRSGSPDTSDPQSHHLGIFHMLVLWLLGYPDTARRYLQGVLAAHTAPAHPLSLVADHEFCVMFHHWCRELRAMQAYAEQMMALAEKYEYTMYNWLGQLYATAASAALGEPNAGSPLVRQSIKTLKARGIHMFVPYCLCLLAEVYAHTGQHREGIAALDEALALSAETGEHLWTAETHRLRGDLLAVRGTAHEAESAYHQAWAIARAQQAKSLELRTAMSLSRLWQA